MPKSGYCSECEASVWLEANGTCPEGHGREAITGTFDIEEPTITRNGVRPGFVFLIVLLVGVAALAGGFYLGNRMGTETGYKSGYAKGEAAGDKRGYSRGNTEGFKDGLESFTALRNGMSSRLIETGFPIKADTWTLIKVKAVTSQNSIPAVANWEVEQQFSDLKDGSFNLDGDNLYNVSSPYQDW